MATVAVGLRGQGIAPGRWWGRRRSSRRGRATTAYHGVSLKRRALRRPTTLPMGKEGRSGLSSLEWVRLRFRNRGQTPRSDQPLQPLGLVGESAHLGQRTNDRLGPLDRRVQGRRSGDRPNGVLSPGLGQLRLDLFAAGLQRPQRGDRFFENRPRRRVKRRSNRCVGVYPQWIRSVGRTGPASRWERLRWLHISPVGGTRGGTSQSQRVGAFGPVRGAMRGAGSVHRRGMIPRSTKAGKSGVDRRVSENTSGHHPPFTPGCSCRLV